MSANGITGRLPERRVPPDWQEIRRVVEGIESVDEQKLTMIAVEALDAIKRRRERYDAEPEREVTPADVQGTIDCVAMAWYALGEILGVPREFVFGDEGLTPLA